MKYSKGIMWLADCRIPFVETDPLQNGISGRDNGKMDTNNQGWGFKRLDREAGLGRFTPNLLVCDDMLNDGVITKQSKRTYKPTSHQGSLFGNSPQAHGEGIGDSGSSSRYYDLDKWFDKIIKELY
jgi:hypothetical protein